MPLTSHAQKRASTIALAIIVTCQLMVVLDATVVNIALVPIKHSLHFSFGRTLVGDRRLQPRLRRTLTPRRSGRRCLRSSTNAHHRTHHIHRRIAPGRHGDDLDHVAADPRRPGCRCRTRGAQHAQFDQRHLRRGARAEQGAGDIHRGVGRRRFARPHTRRRA